MKPRWQARAVSRRRSASRLAAGLLSLLLAGCASSSPARRAARRLPLEPCRQPGISEELLCGTYAVWEDREARRGRKIDLAIVVVPARARHPHPDPVFHFAGGPGGAATRQAGWILDDPLREGRDQVFIDQRGTGSSNPLGCDLGGGSSQPGELREIFPVAGVKACRAELEKRADLRLYTSALAVDDYDEVRRWLGYETINLVGGSYGSVTIQTYMQRHPETVRAAFMRSVLSLERSGLRDQAANAQATLDALLQACRRDAACGAAFPRLEAELLELLARIQRQPSPVEVPDPVTGERLRFPLHRDYLAEHLRRSLYFLSFARALPMAIHLAHDGDFVPLTQLALLFDRAYSGVSLGMMLTIYCSEDLPSFDPAQAVAEAEETIFGSYRIRQQIQACEHWPMGWVPGDFHAPRRLEIPTLMVSGGLDPINPPRYARQAMTHLPNGLHLVIPEGHHGLGGLTHPECIGRLATSFLERGSTAGLDTSCVATMRRQGFVTDRRELEEYIHQVLAAS